MFEKIFTYSSIAKKENRVFGIGDAVKSVLLLLPATGLLLGLFSCYIAYISDDLYTKIYYVIAIVLMLAVALLVVKWLKEMFVVYAIAKNGKIYRFKMFSFAVKYMGLRSKIGETAGKGGGRLQSTFELMMKIKKTIEELDNEEQIDEMFAQGYATELCELKIRNKNERRIKVSAMCSDNTVTLCIRKVYDDWENLFNYLEYVSDNPDASVKDFKFTKKTSYEDFIIKKPVYIKRVARQSLWVLIIAAWLGMIMVSGDINKQSKVNAGLYIETKAEVTGVKDGKGKQKEFSICYDAYGKKYQNMLTSSSNKYKEGKVFELYYQKENPEKYFIFAFKNHINYKPILVLVLFAEAVILSANIQFKKQFSHNLKENNSKKY